MPGETEYVQVEVLGVARDPSDKSVVHLRDSQDRQLKIWIGRCEAVAIAQRLDQSFDAQRPLTQDLALALWKRLGATLQQLRIDDLWEMIYYSKLTVEKDGQLIDIDCRPSDGIALALAAQVPIFVAEAVMEKGTASEDNPEA
ncbi:MAG: bifunctional nuclease family protein [Armatimonadetes bacterium]|nr:bifunctional nuclease family protein [Armatimonadota bacterium]